MTEGERLASVKGMLYGRNCYLLGSGPSLKGFDFNRLRKDFVIAVNHSIEIYPKAGALIFGDSKFLKCTDFDLKTYDGMIFASKKSGMKQINDNVYLYEDKRDNPSLNIHRGLFHPTSTGVAALNLALIMNAKSIYLLGYDYYYTDITHFFGEKYKHHRMYPEGRVRNKVRKFTMFHEWKHRIYNCNPASKIKCFQFSDYKRIPF